MNEWVQNPTSHTALDDILPCVDSATSHETLLRSKEVTSELVNLLNQVITNVSNINFAPNFTPLYYNQSGPLLPLLCNPFTPDLTNRACTAGEVELTKATEVRTGNGVITKDSLQTPFRNLSSSILLITWSYLLILFKFAKLLEAILKPD